jgi:hypothetical protein
MVSPYLTKKSEATFTVNKEAKKLFQVIFTEQNKAEDKREVARIKVSEMISKLSFYYEKIRNTVDYNEEHLLRKSAIERIIKRQIVIEGALKSVKSQEVAENLMIELIRACYLPNNKIPEAKINDIADIIEKYIKLRNFIYSYMRPGAHLISGQVIKAKDLLQDRNRIMNWVLGIAASEIEEALGKDRIKEVVVSNMYEVLVKNIELPKDLPYENDLNIQVYLAVSRVYMKFDNDMLGLVLFRYYNGSWKNPKDEDIAKIARNILALSGTIEAQLNHPLKKELQGLVKKYNVYFSILVNVIKDNPVNVYNSIKNDPKAFPRLIKQTCNARYKEISKKLWGVAIRSILYIFITKSVFAVLLEVPAIKFFGEEINYVSLAINMTFPAVLLFFIVIFTKTPNEKNTEKIIEGINEIVLVEKQRTEPFLLQKKDKRGGVVDSIFNFLYAATFFLSFGAVIWGLDMIHFNWVSIIIFLFFLALVSYFGIKIRAKAKELVVVEPKENIFSFISDFFYIPILAVGKWLSEKFSRLNVFVFILDFVVEAPFKVFVQIAEQWTKYVKERRDNIG